MRTPPSPSVSRSPQTHASPLKRTRAERSGGASEEDAHVSPQDRPGLGGCADTAGTASTLPVYRRPLFPPPPPPPPMAMAPLSSLSSPLGSALGPDSLTGSDTAHVTAGAYASAQMDRHRYAATACRAPLSSSAGGGGSGGGAGSAAAGQRKATKCERPARAEEVETTKKAAGNGQRPARTPSRCATAADDLEAADTQSPRSRSSSAGSWTSYESTAQREEEGRLRGARTSGERPKRASLEGPHWQTSRGSSASACTPETRRRGSRPSSLTSRSRRHSWSTLGSHSQSSARSRSSHSSRSSRSSRSTSSGSSTSSSSSSSRSTGPAAEKEDRVKHYPLFTADYARQFAHDLVPFLLVLENLPAPQAGARPPAKVAAPAKAKSWIANLFTVTGGSGGAPPTPSTGLRAVDEAPLAPALPVPRLVLYNHYVYCRGLGKGTFSKVVSALPAGTDQLVALKVFRDENVYREASWDEVTILNTLCQCLAARLARLAAGPMGSASSEARPLPAVAAAPTVLMSVSPAAAAMQAPATNAITAPPTPAVDPVIHDGRFLAPLGYIPHPIHPAIIYPMLGPSLLHVVRGIRRLSRQRAVDEHEKEKARAMAATSGAQGRRPLYLRGLPLPLLRAVLYQVLQCLCFMHECGVVHTDLKPENILFESTQSKTLEVPIFTLNLNLPSAGSSSSLLPPRTHTDASAMTRTPTGVSHRKRHNDAAKLHSAQSSSARLDRRDESFPSFPSSVSGVTGGGRPGYAADPAFSLNRHLQHTLSVPLPQDNAVRVVDFGSARLVSRFRFACRYDDVCLHTPAFSGVSASKADPSPSALSRTLVSYEPIQTSHYRSPEVLLDLGWGVSADIFSLGCMIPELVTGDCVFMPNDTFEHLAMLEHVIGPMFGTSTAQATSTAAGAQRPLEPFLRCNPRTFAHYFASGARGQTPTRLRWPLKDEDVKALQAQAASAPAPTAQSTAPPSAPSGLFSSTMEHDVGRHASELSPPILTTREDVRFVREKPTLQEMLAHCPPLLDLAEKMLRYHPHDRITAAEALRHPFFQL